MYNVVKGSTSSFTEIKFSTITGMSSSSDEGSQLQSVLDVLLHALIHSTTDNLIPVQFAIETGNARFTIEQLFLLYKIMATVRREQDKFSKLELDQLSGCIQQIANSLFCNSATNLLNLESIWQTIFRPDDSGNLIQTTHSYRKICIQQMYSSYKLIYNFFAGEVDKTWILSITDFRNAIISSLPMSLVSPFIGIFRDFSFDARLSLFSRMLSDYSFSDAVISHLVIEESLDFVSQFLRYIISNKSYRSEDYVCQSIGRLVKVSLNCYDAQAITSTILIPKPCPNCLTRSIIDSFPNESIVDVIDLVSSLWGDKLFISKGDRILQGHYTKIILFCLDRVTMEDLLETSGDLSVVATLSSGVSSYLDLQDKSTRMLGMKVGRKYAKILGHDLQFDELSEHDCDDDTGLRLDTSTEKNHYSLQSRTPSSSSNPKQGSLEASTVLYKSDEDSESGSGGDSDSDSDLEAYAMTEPTLIPETTSYFKNCIEMLQCAETEPEAYDKYRTALHSIPSIAASFPYDAKNLSAHLLKLVLTLPNSFDMKDFDDLKLSSAVALLETFPEWTIPTAIYLVDSSNTISLGFRLATISALVSAASRLSGISERGKQISDSSGSTTSLNFAKADDVITLPHIEGANESNTLVNNTRIKRPRMLAACGQKVKHFHNKFGGVAHLMYFPILQTLIQSIPNTHSTGPGASSYFGGMSISNSLTGIAYLTSDDDEGIQFLLPCKAFKALSEFTRYSINTNYQEIFIENTLKIAVVHRDAHSLSLRRASAEALLAAIESFCQRRKRSDTKSDSIAIRHAGRPLASLMDIAGLGGNSNNNFGSFQSNSDAVTEAIVATIDWAAATFKSDPDLYSRALKYEIIKNGVDCFEQ